MKPSFVFYFFKLTVFTLALAAVFPEKKFLKNRTGVFLLYEVLPVVFVLFWVPMCLMALMKAVQFHKNRDWDELLDIMHMYLVGCLSLYMMCVIQTTTVNYKNTMEILEGKFRTVNKESVEEFFVVLIIWVGIPLCFCLFVGGCIFYKDYMVPLWVTFVDNDKESSTEMFYGIWVYEILVCPYVYFTLTIWGPFIIVSTVCICKELNYLANTVDCYGSKCVANDYLKEGKLGTKDEEALWNGPRVSRFLKKSCKPSSDNTRVFSAIDNVSRINSYVFLVQTIFTVVHSCVLAFNLYYSEELATALFCFPWYKCPHSYKTSMLIMMEFIKRPVHLTAGGIFKASLATFVTCFQQSFSYILELKALTPEKGPS